MSEAPFVVARVKWFNQQKGFGFLQMPEGGLDVFCHANQLRKSGIDKSLTEGQQVRFRIEQGPKGQYAVEISIEGGKPNG